MVLAFKDNHEAAVTMPEGTIFELNGSAPNDYRFVIVTFNGERVRMFASDLPDRAREIKARNGVPRTNRRTHRSAIYQSAYSTRSQTALKWQMVARDGTYLELGRLLHVLLNLLHHKQESQEKMAA